MSTPQPPPSPQPSDPGQTPSQPSSIRPLRRTVVRPAGVVPDPVDAAYVSNRLTVLTHELANLLDGSLRVMSIARRSLSNGAADHLSEQEGLGSEQIGRHMETVYAAMLQMADVVRNTMTGLTPGGPEGMRMSLGATGTLSAAIRHAADVMRPIADDRDIRIECNAGADIDEVPAGSLYGVLVGAIRNAIESIHRSGNGNGCVHVRAWAESGCATGTRQIAIEVVDDGEGPPRIKGDASRNVFTHGYTTKPGGSGVGLSVAREVMEHMGGSIELIPRPVDDQTGRSGAVLRLRFPPPTSRGNVLDRKVG